MQIFHRRPLAFSVCMMAFVSLCLWQADGRIKLTVCAVCLLSFLLLLGWSILRRACPAIRAIPMLCFLLSAFSLFSSWLFFNVSVMRMEKRAAMETEIEGYVLERIGETDYQTEYSVRVTELDGERMREKVRLVCEYDAEMEIGDRFRLKAELPSLATNGAYRENQTLYADGFVGSVFCEAEEDCTVLDTRANHLELLFFQWRACLSARLSRAIEGEAGALASALLLGDRSELSEKTVLDFRRAGVSHLLALSGLHVSVLLGIFAIFTRWMTARARALLLPLISFFYLFLTGCSPSAFRAVLMAFGLYMGIFLQEDYDSFTSITTALAVILIVTPYSALDISLWLSFAAATAIVVFYPATAQWMAKNRFFKALPKALRRMVSALVSAVVIGLFANAAILPLSALWFGSTSVFSGPITLLLSPLLAPALVLSILSLLLPSFKPLSFFCGLCMDAMRAVTAWVSELPNGTVLLDGGLCTVLLVALASLLILFAVILLRKKRILILPILLSLAVLFCGYANVIPMKKGIGVTYLRDQHRNEMLLLSQGRRAVAVDLSSGSYAISYELLDAIFEVKCTELEELVLTHYHEGSLRLLSVIAARLKTRVLRLPIPLDEEELAIAAHLTEEAKRLGIAVITGYGEMEPNGVDLLCLERTGGSGGTCSLALLLRVGDRHITYLSSGIKEEPLLGIAQNLTHTADLLILGAHGKQGLEEAALLQRLGSSADVVLCANDMLGDSVRAAFFKETKLLFSPERYQVYFKVDK